MATFGSVAACFVGPPLSVPFTPPHAARSAPALDIVSPAAPSRRISCRRETRPSATCSKKRSSSRRSGSVIYGLLGDENGVGGVPRDGHFTAGADRLGLCSEAVLFHGGELLPAGCVHH